MMETFLRAVEKKNVLMITITRHAYEEKIGRGWGTLTSIRSELDIGHGVKPDNLMSMFWACHKLVV